MYIGFLLGVDDKMSVTLPESPYSTIHHVISYLVFWLSMPSTPGKTQVCKNIAFNEFWIKLQITNLFDIHTSMGSSNKYVHCIYTCRPGNEDIN